MFFASTAHLPKDLTSYDLLKSFAVITMVIDHIGMYLFPEQNEWRIIGRMSMPVWLFLIGYARSRDLSNLLWIGGFILVLSDFIVGEAIFNVNILFTILLARLLLDTIMEVFFKSRESMFWITFALIILVLPSAMLFDYGTHAFLFAMFGYLVRHQTELSLHNRYILAFMAVAVIAHSLFQKMMFGFSDVEAAFCATGVFLICLYMTNFKLKLYPVLTSRLPIFATGFVKLMGRHSLEIYVIHLIILKAIAFPLFPEHFGWFQWRWF